MEGVFHIMLYYPVQFSALSHHWAAFCRLRLSADDGA